eukprot:scaffold148919_cov35-Tisochrysis_lutea.AAC.1
MGKISSCTFSIARPCAPSLTDNHAVWMETKTKEIRIRGGARKRRPQSSRVGLERRIAHDRHGRPTFARVGSKHVK